MNNKNITSKKKIFSNKTLKKKNIKKTIIENFINMLNTVKLFHWKTYSYATHEATDKLYNELNENIDKFIETMIGKSNSRIPDFSTKTELINSSSSKSFKKKVFSYRSYLQDMNNIFDSKIDSDILSIRDDILININQFIYLISFKK